MLWCLPADRRLPHSMQHVESGENLVKILIAREVAGPEAERIAASRSRFPHPGPGGGGVGTM